MKLPPLERKDKWDNRISERTLWLWGFFLVQVCTDLAYIKLLGSWSDLVGKVIIAMSLPMGIMAYSKLYFKPE